MGDNAAGYMRALVAGDKFRGFAYGQADNSASAVAGAIRVDVIPKGFRRVTLSGIAITDVGKPVYMSDDATFTLTGTSNSFVGYVHRYVDTDTCVIEFDDMFAAPLNTLSRMATGIKPSHVVKYAGTGNLTAGQTAHAITVTGVAATDIVTAVVRASTNAVSVVKCVPTANTITVTTSADPGATSTVDYTVLRAVAE